MALPAPSDQDPDALEPRLEAVIARARRTGPEPAAPPAHGRMNPVAAGLFAALAGLQPRLEEQRLEDEHQEQEDAQLHVRGAIEVDDRRRRGDEESC